MPWDLKFDPITGDLVPDGAGGWERTEHSDTAVWNQLTIHWERWWADPDIGSRLFERDEFTSDPAPLVEAETRRALQLLVDENLIADVRVVAVESSAGRVDVRTLYRLVATGQDVETFLPILNPGA
jgi:phage gp46-like protein